MERKINGYINKLGELIKLKIFKEDIEDFNHTHEISDINGLSESIDNIDSRVTELEQHAGDEDRAKADKVEGAVDGNLAGLDDEGNLTDSGKAPSDFAPAVHTHNQITDFNGFQGCGATVSVGEGDQGEGVITLLIKGDGRDTESKTAEIDYFSMDNLNRALDTTQPPTAGSDKLSTSGQIYTALARKTDMDFSNKIYARLMEFEKLSSIKYSITATYAGIEGGKIKLMLDDNDIVKSSSVGSNPEISALWHVPYLYNLVFVGDTLEARNLTVMGDPVLGTATVTSISSGPPTISLSGLLCKLNASNVGNEIQISIIHN